MCLGASIPGAPDRDEGNSDPETYSILGAAFAVHSELGCGFLEAVYREALAREFSVRGIQHASEISLTISYRGEELNQCYRADFICYRGIIVEIKALGDLTGVEIAQAINYLKASRLDRALLLNFGRPRLQFRRIVLSHRRAP